MPDTMELVWYPDDPQECFNVTLVDDSSYEEDEQFSVILDSMDGSVSISMASNTTITIRDNDGK